MTSVFEIINKIKNNTGIQPAQRIEALKSAIQDVLGAVKLVEERVVAGTGNRVILTTLKNHGDFTQQFAAECNGIVLDGVTFSVLAVPPHALNPKYRVSDLAANIDKYKVYPITDGSIVTLYHYAGGWCMATANAYSADNMSWLTNTTYRMALDELFTKFGYSYDKLDVARCYTIGFRHHDFHPLQTDPARVWFVQSVNLADLSVDFVSDYFPMIEPITITDGVKFMAAAKATNTSALNKYFISRKTDKAEHHYGYIFRGSFTELGPMANVTLESTLMGAVKSHVYNMPQIFRKYKLNLTTSNTRMMAIILHAYLGAEKYMFCNLFPQFMQQYSVIDKELGLLCKRVLSGLRNKSIRAAIMSAKDSEFDKLARIHIRSIEKDINVRPVDRQLGSIVGDYVNDRGFFGEYVELFVQPKETADTNPKK